MAWRPLGATSIVAVNNAIASTPASYIREKSNNAGLVYAVDVIATAESPSDGIYAFPAYASLGFYQLYWRAQSVFQICSSNSVGTIDATGTTTQLFSAGSQTTLVCSMEVATDSSSYVTGIRVYFCDGTASSLYGSPGIKQSTFTSPASDPIVKVVVNYGTWINGLRFTTKSGVVSEQIGGSGGGSVEINLGEGLTGVGGELPEHNL